jgi:predicted RNA binding protein YcfA (HicA-like mRNA interferase family)
MNGYEKLLKELLLKHGCKLFRSGKGSHEIWLCPNGVSVTVNHNCKSRHTANSILKDAGIANQKPQLASPQIGDFCCYLLTVF